MMRLVRVLALVAIIVVATASPPAVRAGTTIMVNTTEDPPLTNGNCAIREAFEAANTDHVVDGCAAGSGTDTIAFNIGDPGSSQIINLSGLLQISTQVILDGTSQPGYAGIPLIHITRVGTNLIAFYGAAGGSIIQGLKFSRVGGGAGSALILTGDSYQVKACYFNTDGTASLDNDSTGITLVGSNSTIGGPDAPSRNLFGGRTGILVDQGTGNTIEGNFFGVDTSGSTALTGSYGAGSGIDISPGATPSNSNTVRGNVIGGFSHGILLSSPTASNTIVGNHIGVGADGSSAIGNGSGIVVYSSSTNTIGGTTAAERNVISASTMGNNIHLFSGGGLITPDGNTIQGNYIGTDEDGMNRLSLGTSGIYLGAGSNNVIGGTAAGAGNVISGNSTGIMLDAGVTGTIIQGNMIGTDPGGTISVRNDNGIHTDTAVSIGDSVTPGNNIIAGSISGAGILMHGTSGSTIYGNRIGVSAASKSLPNRTGVTLSNASATFGGNWIAFNTQDGITLDTTSTVSSDSTMNCFTGNGVYAVNNANTAHEAPFTQNWWHNHTGPTHLGNFGGTGDAVTNHVAFSPYLTLPAAACHIFADVPVAGKEWMEPWVDAFYLQGITTGCGANPLTYCPENPVTRAAMAVFILRAIEGPTYTPPAAHGYFDDLPIAGKEWMEPWVDEFYNRGITTGCGTSPLRYCPENPVTRAAMAVFLLRALEGSSYVPDHTDHYFSDLPVTGKEWMEPFVDEFYDRGITTGCGTDPLTYCPENPVTRAAMAVFISRAYNLYP